MVGPGFTLLREALSMKRVLAVAVFYNLAYPLIFAVLFVPLHYLNFPLHFQIFSNNSYWAIDF